MLKTSVSNLLRKMGLFRFILIMLFLFYTALFISSIFFGDYPIVRECVLDFLCPTVTVLAVWKTSTTKDPIRKFPWKKGLVIGFVFFLLMIVRDVTMEDMAMKQFTAIILFGIFFSHLITISMPRKILNHEKEVGPA